MSNCIKDLYDYDLLKKCCRCGIISLKSNFHKNKKSKDGLFSQCKFCTKKYYVDNQNRLVSNQRLYDLKNRDKIHTRMKDYYLQNRDRIKEYKIKNHDKIKTQKRIYSNDKYKSDINFRLICKTRSRIYKSLKGMTKQSSTKEILGIDIDAYRKWVEFQFTPEMNWENIEIDHVKPICMFDVSDDEQLKQAFSWQNTQPLLKHIHHQKGTKFNFQDYQLQFIKAYQFIKLNEEGSN